MSDAGVTDDVATQGAGVVPDAARWAVLVGGVLVVLRGAFTLLNIVTYTGGVELSLGPLWAIALPYPGIGGEGLYGLLAAVSLVVGAGVVTAVLLPRGRGPAGVGGAGAAIVVAHLIGSVVVALTLMIAGNGPVWSIRVAVLGLLVSEVLFSLLVLALGAAGAIAGLSAARQSSGSGRPTAAVPSSPLGAQPPAAATGVPSAPPPAPPAVVPPAPAPPAQPSSGPEPTDVEEPTRQPCPDCAELIAVGARVCRFCGYDLETGTRPAQP